MTMKVSCGICGAILFTVSKPIITQDDEQMYQQDVACDTDGQANIVIEIKEE